MEVRSDRSDDGSSLGGEDSTLRTSDGGGVVGRGHFKGLLTAEVEVAENTDKEKIARHKKIRAVVLISC